MIPPLLLPPLLHLLPPSTASSAAPSVKRVFKLDADDACGVSFTAVYELASESSEVQSVAEVDWWCRIVHYDLQGDEGEQEAIDWSLDGCECCDLTMSGDALTLTVGIGLQVHRSEGSSTIAAHRNSRVLTVDGW